MIIKYNILKILIAIHRELWPPNTIKPSSNQNINISVELFNDAVNQLFKLKKVLFILSMNINFINLLVFKHQDHLLNYYLLCALCLLFYSNLTDPKLD